MTGVSAALAVIGKAHEGLAHLLGLDADLTDMEQQAEKLRQAEVDAAKPVQQGLAEIGERLDHLERRSEVSD